MTDRKMTVLRLVIFCVLSFVPFWIILPMMNAACGGGCPSGEIRFIMVSPGPYPATDMPLAYRI